MKIIKAPVTCSDTSIALLSLINEKKGITNETKMKPIRIVEQANTDLLFMKAVIGIWLYSRDFIKLLLPLLICLSTCY